MQHRRGGRSTARREPHQHVEDREHRVRANAVLARRLIEIIDVLHGVAERTPRLLAAAGAAAPRACRAQRGCWGTGGMVDKLLWGGVVTGNPELVARRQRSERVD